MKKILTIVGARPQFIKAAAIHRVIKQDYQNKMIEILVHTGQHYDKEMSAVFFDELAIEPPAYHLGIGSGEHGAQVGAMMIELEKILKKEKPSIVLVYGDTNSTLAGALVAAKMHIPVAHVEAGLRSFDKTMPEEINRLLVDHVSTLLFCPTHTSIENLKKEGLENGSISTPHINHPFVFHSGDVMYDSVLYYADRALQKRDWIKKLGLEENNFVLATIHRAQNTDDKERLVSIVQSLLRLATEYNYPVVLPIHPRTRKMMENYVQPDFYAKIVNNTNLKIIAPVSYLEMIALERMSRMIITDSGGVQKEAFFLQKPCIILRAETEWVELLHEGSVLADADEQKIVALFNTFLKSSTTSYQNTMSIFGNGKSSFFICDKLYNYC